MDHDPLPEKSEALKGDIQQARTTSDQTVKGSKIATDFLAAVLGCTFIGWLIDKFLDTKPWAVVVMLIVGFIMGVYSAWRSLSQTAPD